MGEIVSRPPQVPRGYRVRQMGDGRYYPQYQGDDGKWHPTTVGGDNAKQQPEYAAGYRTPEEAEQQCWRHARAHAVG